MTAKIEKVNPDTMPDAPSMGYSQITVAEGQKLIFMAGQVAWSRDGAPVPDDLGEQATLAIKNVRAGLEAVGATAANIVSVRVYVVTPTQEDWNAVFGAAMPFFDGEIPTITAIGVASLAGDGLQVEIEVPAVV